METLPDHYELVFSCENWGSSKYVSMSKGCKVKTHKGLNKEPHVDGGGFDGYHLNDFNYSLYHSTQTLPPTDQTPLWNFHNMSIHGAHPLRLLTQRVWGKAGGGGAAVSKTPQMIEMCASI